MQLLFDENNWNAKFKCKISDVDHSYTMISKCWNNISVYVVEVLDAQFTYIMHIYKVHLKA